MVMGNAFSSRTGLCDEWKPFVTVLHLSFFGPISIFSKCIITHKNRERKATCGNPPTYSQHNSKPNHGAQPFIQKKKRDAAMRRKHYVQQCRQER
jgi:hypothetical protein